MQIPVVSMKDHGSGAFSHLFGQWLEEFGFVSVVDHGISPELLVRAYDVAKRVFAYPDDTLQKYCNPSHGFSTGFTPFGQEHAKYTDRRDLKRFWHVRRRTHLTPPNIFPEEVPEFGPITLDLFDALEALSFKLGDALDVYLKKAPGAFRGMMLWGGTLLRVLHYPSLERVDARPDEIRSSAHEDINLITLLPASFEAGLEILPRDKLGDKWVAVENPLDAIIVNSGDMLKMMTGGRIPSTTHRVVNTSRERYSLPCFVHPRGDVVLCEEDGRPVTAKMALDRRLREIGLL